MHSQSGKRAAALPSNAALDKARSAWSRGDFIGCLALLDDLPPAARGSAAWVEATLLQTRSLNRLWRFSETIALLEPVIASFPDGDESCTARMLLGSSISRSGDIERGLAILEATAAQAEAQGVHRAICAEIAVTRAVAHWTRREHDETERLARFAEAADADIISVHATQLRAFVAQTQHRFAEALDLFNVTYDAYWRCSRRDAVLVEMTVQRIAGLELVLRSRDVRGTHTDPDRRRVRDPWDTTPEVASATRMQTLVLDAWLFAHDGDRDTAFRLMRRAEEMETDTAWRVWAIAGRARMAAVFGELGSAREHAALGAELVTTVDWQHATRGEERMGLLLLTETLAMTDPEAAVATLKTYDAIVVPMHRDQAFSTDPRFQATEDNVRGLVLRATGREAAARKLLKSAANRYAGCGHLWRAVAARLALAATSPGAADLDELREIVAEHFPKSFLARQVGLDGLADPIVAGLTPAQRDVLALLLAGQNARDIAAHTGRAYNTVRVHIDRLREAFKTSSIHAMVVDCHRRGIVLPARVRQARKDEAVRTCG